MSKIAAIIGRIMLALIFILSGIGKLMDLPGTEASITGVGLPGGFAIVVGLFELLAGLALAAGFMVRLVSLLLLVFTAATILFYHNQFNDPVQGAMALKNLAIMGGLLLAFAHSQMWSHYYSITRERKGEMAARDAEKRVQEAELRAARAEGLVEGQSKVAAAPVTTAPANTATDTVTVTDVDGDGIPETRRRNRWFDW